MSETKELFKNNGKDFSALSAAEKWCCKNGYRIGTMQREAPIGIARDCDYISKWRNMTPQEKSRLDGTINQLGGFKKGDVEVIIFN